MFRILQKKWTRKSNIFSSTLKYSEKDIEINLGECNGKAVLRVSNICTSISEDDVVHIFDRFYMADQVRKGQSVGIGLSIVKSLMKKMDGVIISKLEDSGFLWYENGRVYNKKITHLDTKMKKINHSDFIRKRWYIIRK